MLMMPIRRLNLHKIRKLDPKADHRLIVYKIACSEFSFDAARSMELAFFRTFAIPSISHVLHSTGKFLHATQCRVDDTDILLSEILEQGYDGPRGRRAIARINRIHADFELDNSDMIYVLSTFIIEPQKWMEQFAWRALHPVELEALYHFWVQVGLRMGIKDIPSSLDELKSYSFAYENEHFHYTPQNHELAKATQKNLLSHFLPDQLHHYGEPLFNAFLDDPLLKACGLAPAPKHLRWILQRTMKLRSHLSSLRPNTTKHRTQVSIESYPNGYTIEQVGGSHLSEEQT